MKTVIQGKELSFGGIFEMHNAFLKIQEGSFSIDRLNIMLPFDLFYPSAPESALRETKRGQTGFI
jgi:hypothetical protein